jgi:hypothetical protein
MRNISYKVALGGIICALCLLSMFLTGIIPALSLVLPMISGMLLRIVAEEIDMSWSFLTYAAVSLLSLIISFDKESALIFIMFFGHYPILRIFIQKIKAAFLRRLTKLTVFNICIVSHFYLTAYLLGMTAMLDEINGFGKHGAIIMLSIANIVFALYDYNLDICYCLYIKKLRPKFNKSR